MNHGLQRTWQRSLRRIGLPGVLAVLLCLPLLALAVWLPNLGAQGDALRTALAAQAEALARQPEPARRPASRMEQVAAFRAGLPPLAQSAGDVRTVFDIARRHKLALPKGEYQLKADAGGSLITYSVTLPLHSEYTVLKAFAVEVLETLPHASLEELRMSRADAGSTVLDFQVRFTVTYRGL